MKQYVPMFEQFLYESEHNLKGQEAILQLNQILTNPLNFISKIKNEFVEKYKDDFYLAMVSFGYFFYKMKALNLTIEDVLKKLPFEEVEEGSENEFEVNEQSAKIKALRGITHVIPMSLLPSAFENIFLFKEKHTLQTIFPKASPLLIKGITIGLEGLLNLIYLRSILLMAGEVYSKRFTANAIPPGSRLSSIKNSSKNTIKSMWKTKMGKFDLILGMWMLFSLGSDVFESILNDLDGTTEKKEAKQLANALMELDEKNRGLVLAEIEKQKRNEKENTKNTLFVTGFTTPGLAPSRSISSFSFPTKTNKAPLSSTYKKELEQNAELEIENRKKNSNLSNLSQAEALIDTVSKLYRFSR